METILKKFQTLLKKQKSQNDKPTIIEVKTVIGFGSPNRSGKSDAHGMPLGKDETLLAKAAYKWSFEEDFYVPEEVYDTFKQASERLGVQEEAAWNEKFEEV